MINEMQKKNLSHGDLSFKNIIRKSSKQFMLKNFKNLLLTIHTLPLEAQEKALVENFENWKNQIDQIDDILVFGIRVLV